MAYVPVSQKVKCSTLECHNITAAGKCVVCKSAASKITRACATPGCLYFVRKNEFCSVCTKNNKRVLQKCIGDGCPKMSHNELCATCTNRMAAESRKKLKTTLASTKPKPAKGGTLEDMIRVLESKGYSVDKIAKIESKATLLS